MTTTAKHVTRPHILQSAAELLAVRARRRLEARIAWLDTVAGPQDDPLAERQWRATTYGADASDIEDRLAGAEGAAWRRLDRTVPDPGGRSRSAVPVGCRRRRAGARTIGCPRPGLARTVPADRCPGGPAVRPSGSADLALQCPRRHLATRAAAGAAGRPAACFQGRSGGCRLAFRPSGLRPQSDLCGPPLGSARRPARVAGRGDRRPGRRDPWPRQSGLDRRRRTRQHRPGQLCRQCQRPLSGARRSLSARR